MRMYQWVLLGMIVGLVGFAEESRADMLWLVESEEPLPGRVISETRDAIEYRYRVGEAEQTSQFKRSEIKELVVTIDQEALKNLNPNNLRAYLDQAEQLSANRQDPYAIETAKRLCLIVARWGSTDLKESAFLLLVSICEGEELVRVRSLAYVYHPSIEFQEASSGQTNGPSKDARESLVELIQLVCRERSAEVKQRLKDEAVVESVRQTLDSFSSICSFEEFSAAVDAQSLSLTQLGRMLKLEKALETNVVPQNTRRPGLGSNWFAASEQIDASGSVLPEFGNVLGIDPSLTVYRDGEWVAPKRD